MITYLDRIRIHTSAISGLMFDDVHQAELMAHGSSHRVSPCFDDVDENGDEEDRLLVDGFSFRKAPRRVSNRAIKRPKVSDARMIPLLAVRNQLPTLRAKKAAEKNGNGHH